MISADNTLNTHRDDLTVQVIFFGNGEKAQSQSEEVVVNKDATAPPKPLKAKL
jgi:pyruvate dehydrogenase phosphatase